MQRIVVLGGGFAGLWAAAGAARKREELGQSPDELDIVLVDRNPYHNIRVRNYEAELADVIVPIARVLDPIGVRHRVAEVRAIDPAARRIAIAAGGQDDVLAYDALVVALGSALPRPPLPGLALHSFDVDTYAAATRLADHLAALAAQPASPARDTVAVAGAGFTGIEVATEMPARLRAVVGARTPRVILIDGATVAGATIGGEALPVIAKALDALGVETRLGARHAAVEAERNTMTSGETIPCATLVWCAGMRASPLAAALRGAHDGLGRIVVDPCLRVPGADGVFAAGDVASSLIDGARPTGMSCQFARPMGRFAGHNVVAHLAGGPLKPLTIDWYVTVLDLGPWGALYTSGWQRRVLSTGDAAKQVKRDINCRRIYPPPSFARADILAAAAPVVQPPPPQLRSAAVAVTG
jgi:NADH dehydrogenase